VTGVDGTGTPGADELWDRLRARVEPERLAWLVDAVEAVRADPAALATRFPAAGRHVGRGPLASNGNEYGWTVDDAARVLLILAGAGAEDGDVWRQLDELYRYGDAAERRGVLRSLAFLPGDGGLSLVEDAVRTNDPRLLASALGPYGLAHLDDEALDQAVLKCVFVGVPLAALPRQALAERTRPALSRMLAAYVRERVAAGRDVPADVWPLIEAHPPQDELAALRAELDHPVPGRRAAAVAALAQRAGGNSAHSGDQRHL
jgi:hypothetical protein